MLTTCKATSNFVFLPFGVFLKLYHLWRKRISLCHKIFQPYKLGAHHPAQEAETLVVLPSHKLPGCTVKRILLSVGKIASAYGREGEGNVDGTIMTSNPWPVRDSESRSGTDKYTKFRRLCQNVKLSGRLFELFFFFLSLFFLIWVFLLQLFYELHLCGISSPIHLLAM